MPHPSTSFPLPRTRRLLDIALESQSTKIGPREVFEMLCFVWRARMNPLRLRQILGTVLINLDQPRHTALRGTVNRGFTPRRVRAWEPRIREIVDECLSKLKSGQSFDVVHDLAIPLPVGVIAEIVGIEPERGLRGAESLTLVPR